MITNAKINSITDYINIITRYSKLKDETVYFRGQNLIAPLLPALARNQSLLYHEDSMITALKLAQPSEFAGMVYPVNMLAKMQHSGLPTRLLDVTENALIALYFAAKDDCQNKRAGKKREDGEVFCFKAKQLDVRSAYCVYANLAASMWENCYIEADKFMKDASFQDFFPKSQKNLLDELRAENGEESETLTDAERFVLAMLISPFLVKPEKLCEREKRQQAAFIIFPNDISEKEKNRIVIEQYKISDLESRLQELSKFRKPMRTNLTLDLKIRIAAEVKDRLIEELALLGVTEQFLFPELEKQCEAIKRAAMSG